MLPCYMCIVATVLYCEGCAKIMAGKHVHVGSW